MKWKTDKGENYCTFMPPTFSVTFDWDRLMKFRLPPRFKIFHNVSEDYYFIKERFCLFWYRVMTKEVGYQYFARLVFATVEEAQQEIETIIEYEKQAKTPDVIELVKEL